MRKKTVIISLVSVFSAVIGLFFYVNNIDDYTTKSKLESFRKSITINHDKLKPGYGKNVKREFKDGIEYGIITLKDNSIVKYYCLSHHLVAGKGGTLFELPDGKTEFISGVFCCEMQLDSIYSDVGSFIQDMRLYDGVAP